MKRTTIYLQSELEVLLKLEMLRQKRPMAEPGQAPPGAGAFASGHADTAERADAVLSATGFGGRPAPARQPRRKATTKKKRR